TVGWDFFRVAKIEEFIRFYEDGDQVHSFMLRSHPFALGVLLPLIESKRKRFTVVQDFPHKGILVTSVPWRELHFSAIKTAKDVRERIGTKKKSRSGGTQYGAKEGELNLSPIIRLRLMEEIPLWACSRCSTAATS